MSIKDIALKIKPFYSLLLILVIGSIFFAIGRLSSLEERQTPLKIEYSSATSSAAVILSNILPGGTSDSATTTQITPSEAVIGSKSGKKYYFPWCGTIKRVKPENQVPFASIESARMAGYLPGGNCKGLK